MEQGWNNLQENIYIFLLNCHEFCYIKFKQSLFIQFVYNLKFSGSYF